MLSQTDNLTFCGVHSEFLNMVSLLQFLSAGDVLWVSSISTATQTGDTVFRFSSRLF